MPGTGLVGIGTAKAIGNVPRRNRQKRRLRVALSRTQFAVAGLDWVAVGKLAIVEANFDDLCNEVTEMVDTLNKRWESESESG